MNGPEGEKGGVRAAAIQLETSIGDVEANLAACERLADEAADAGAELIMLPEFFTTGIGFRPELQRAVLSPDGPATELLCELARRHDATVGGSFLCHDSDGEVRNAFFLATPSGLVGRHDKDIPSTWENCFYVGGSDDGLLEVAELSIGVALCLEFNRTQTVRRLRSRVDIVVGGSFTWGAPQWVFPARLRRHVQASAARYCAWAPRFARLVGAPVVEASHCGALVCRSPGLPGLPYKAPIGSGAHICDATGAVLARRDPADGPGYVIADVVPARVPPIDPVPNTYWIEPLDRISQLTWHLHNAHGRRWYRRHALGRRPPPEAERRSEQSDGPASDAPPNVPIGSEPS